MWSSAELVYIAGYVLYTSGIVKTIIDWLIDVIMHFVLKWTTLSAIQSTGLQSLF